MSKFSESKQIREAIARKAATAAKCELCHTPEGEACSHVAIEQLGRLPYVPKEADLTLAAYEQELREKREGNAFERNQRAKELKFATLDKILAGKTHTAPMRFSEDRLVLTGNRFCGLCSVELDIMNQVQIFHGYLSSNKLVTNTLQTWANTCLTCTKQALRAVSKATRKLILKEIADQIALNIYFELGEKFSSAQDFLESNWLESTIGLDLFRQLGLIDRSLLPRELANKHSRKLYRKAEHREVYMQIKIELSAKFPGYCRQ